MRGKKESTRILYKKGGVLRFERGASGVKGNEIYDGK